MTTQPEALRLAEFCEGNVLYQPAAAELRRLAAVEAQRDALLEALKGMEDRFGCESSRSETKPKTYGCRHMAETCGNCYRLVTGWMAVQAARAAIKAVEGETNGQA